MNLAFKRHYPLILTLLCFVLVVGLVFGNERIIAYTSDRNREQATLLNADQDSIQNDIFLFDDTVVHSISINMDDDDYNTMISTYQQTGEKEYFHADITIDGVIVENVGIRLKGNASLRSALGGNGGGAPGGRNNADDNQAQFPGQRPGADQQTDQADRPQHPDGVFPQTDQQEGAPGNLPGQQFNPQDNTQAYQPGQNMRPGQNIQPDQGNLELHGSPQRDLQAAQPQGEFQVNNAQQTAPQNQADNQRAGGMGGQTNIPYQIKFDKYEDGQTYQGYSTIAIRVSGTSFDAAMMHEPVTNNAVRRAGIPATLTSYTGFNVNTAAEKLYVISEVIDETYLAKYFDNPDGILYKAEVGSTMSYVDDNPSSYKKSFSQETRENEADFGPLIDFIRFVDESDDETFAEELPNRLDIDSFATYLAVNTLLVNNDSMIGMNNNYYLYYDDINEQFTLLMWDANESLGKMGNAGNMNIDLSSSSMIDGNMRGGRMGGKNNLLARFIANDEFNALYKEKVRALYKIFYTDGTLEEDVNTYAALIHAPNDDRQLVDIDAYDQAVQKILDFITQRTTYLLNQPIINQ